MQRYIALDALRGLTIAAMIMVNTPGSWSHVYAPLLHAKWHGITPTDLVFPFFLFIVGSAMFFAFKKYNFQVNRDLMYKIIKRGSLLFLIGFFLNIYPFTTSPESWRIMGVLQRIGLAYIAAAIIVLCCKRSLIWGICGALLLSYHLALSSVPGGYELASNLVSTLDIQVLGSSHMYQGFGIPFEPEGLLSTIPAVVSTLIGFEVTRTLSQTENKRACMRLLVMLGMAGVIGGLAMSVFIPINKALWSSSYVIHTAGYACLLLALFVFVIDIKHIENPIKPLLIYGTNPLFIYVLSWIWVASYPLVNVNGVALNEYMFNSLALVFPDKMASLIFALSHVLFFWWCSKALYQRNIFIKL